MSNLVRLNQQQKQAIKHSIRVLLLQGLIKKIQELQQIKPVFTVPKGTNIPNAKRIVIDYRALRQDDQEREDVFEVQE